jgi:hypothetical protein
MKETIMKISITLSAVALGLASMGLAQAAQTSGATANMQGDVVSSEVGHDPYYPHIVEQGGMTRGQVMQQLQQAESSGTATSGHDDPYYPQSVIAHSPAATTTPATRSQ